MQIAIINGPNLNLLGKREPDIYGSESFEDYLEKLKKLYPQVAFSYWQTNAEGGIIDQLHAVGFSADGILLNAGGYTHTSVAIRDAIAAIKTPVLEIHISNIHAREEFRHKSMIAPKCVGSICGLGMKGYQLGVEYFL
ncbi:type II 3-dehydroquinate dehydratase [Chitinophaga sp. sic0106]|uniref:type II 3-dehydroquinate dehydratase n=1 Tax=Chitinophaga sp. sic0106 TaxID=2854785 RepID=UPI001C479B86|nr:type II 3-dehydroquinate dehydratase [Chitinophaga sp. sic0106]MBV7532211.1 type II 3-dehydroquinate dehydratase [Chitinophaga sp. sic0106]